MEGFVAGHDAGVPSAARTLEDRKISRRNGGISPGDVDQAAFDEGAAIDNPESVLQRQERFPRVR